MTGQFDILPKRAKGDRRLNLSDFKVLAILQERSSDKGYCWPAYNRIAEDCCISKRTAIYAVKRLVQYGYLVKAKRTIDGTEEQTSNTYYIKFDPE